MAINIRRFSTESKRIWSLPFQKPQMRWFEYHPHPLPASILFNVRMISSIPEITKRPFHNSITFIAPFEPVATVRQVSTTNTTEDAAVWIEKAISLISGANQSTGPAKDYKEALESLRTALKIQKKLKQDTSFLEKLIAQTEQKYHYLKCTQNASLYISETELQTLNTTLDLYKNPTSLLDSLQLLLDVQEELQPHHHFLQAVIHESRGEYLGAFRCFLTLSNDPVRAPACLEKAYSLLGVAAKESPDLLLRFDAIRRSFQKHLQQLSKLSPQVKTPECFVSYSLTEADVAYWLEHSLVPDMDAAEIKPIVSFRDLSPNNFLDNFQNLAWEADAVVVVCTPEYKVKYEERKKAPVGLAMEVKIIHRRLESKDKAENNFIIYLKGSRDEVLPSSYFNQNLAPNFGSFSDPSFEFKYFSNALSLLGAIRQVPKPEVRQEIELFFKHVKELLAGRFNTFEVKEWKQAQEQEQKTLQISILDRIATKTQILSIPPPDKYFTGRVEELAQLHEKCKYNRRVAIYGLGGVGKTALALKYAEDHQSNYQWIHFVPSSTPEAMILGLLKLADELHIPRLEKEIERLQLLKAQLEKLESEYLLVFDGVDSPDTFKEIQKYLPDRGKCILVTSRLEEDLGRLGFNQMKLDLLTEKEAVKYLFKATGIEDEEGAKRLAKKLCYLPLALTHAASFIRVQGCSFEKYLEQFEKYDVRLFEDKHLRLTAAEKTVLTTWQITMDVLETQEKSFVAKPLLDFMAFLASSNIPYEALRLWSEKYAIDELEFGRALGLLINYSMLNKLNESYSVHPVVQMVIRYQLTPEKKQEWLGQGIKTFSTLIEGHDLERLEKRDITNAIILNCETLIGYYDFYQCNRKSEDFLDVLNYLTRCHHHFGRMTQAHVYAEKSLALAKEMHPNLDHPLVATSLNNVGGTLEALGRHEEALKYQIQALELSIKLLGPEHPDVASSLNNVGYTLRELGRHDEALKYEKEALGLRIKLLSPEHPDVASSLNNMGCTLRELGRHDEALKYEKEALELRIKLLGAEHPDVASSLNNVGITLGELGRHGEALKYEKEALELRIKLLGAEHPDVASSLNNVGIRLGELGRHGEALKYQIQALELKKKLLSEKHPDVATSLNNVGGTLEALGRHEEALKYKKAALELWKKCLGFEHPSVATSLNNVGCTLGELGRHGEALKYKMQALELRVKLLGPEHPTVATSLNNVGITLGELGRHGEALKYKMQALELRVKLLGHEHPSVATSLSNVGETLGALGRHGEALKYQIQALELRVKLLSPEHPSVATSLSNVGYSLGELGRHEEALKYKKEALELRIKLLGPEHPLVASSLNNAGHSLGELGRHEEALKYQIQALELWKKCLGFEHLSVATSLNNVGSALGALGKHEEALKYQIQALELWKKCLGFEHPSVAIGLNNVGGTLGDLGRHEEALRYLKEALELRKKCLGSEHPDMAISLKNLGFMLGALGRHEEELGFHKEAHELIKIRFGSSHISVANSLNDIGHCYQKLNNTKEAQKCLLEAYEMARGLLGASHPITIKFKQDWESI